MALAGGGGESTQAPLGLDWHLCQGGKPEN